MPKMPIRLPLLRLRRTRVKYIVIHNTAELYPITAAQIDNSQFQTPKIISNLMEKNLIDINYNFLVEKIGDEYWVICARPFVLLCDFPDIEPSINNMAIHIGVLGDYNKKLPDRRLYSILAYRLVSALLKQFRLGYDRIFLHKELSTTPEETTCPGEFFDKAILLSFARKYIMR
jgi:hypothetical protein